MAVSFVALRVPFLGSLPHPVGGPAFSFHLGNRPLPPPALPISPDIAGVFVLPVLQVRSPAAATSCPSPMWNRTPSGGRLLLRPGRCPRHQLHEHLAELRHVSVSAGAARFV